MAKKIFYYILVLIAAYFGRMGIEKLMAKDTYKGEWYTIKIPEGWEVKEEEGEAAFLAPEKDLLTDAPEAIFSIYGYKSKGALFLGDVYAQVMQELSQANGNILDHGEVLLDGIVARWVLFHNLEPPLAILSFYLVDDWNRLIRLQYIVLPKKFNHYRPQFEKFKDSLKIKRLF